MTQLQPYVLRSWEKEFPWLGIQKTQDSPRVYRQADVDQVLRIKQLVFVEGLTLSGARRRLEDSLPRAPEVEDAEVLETLGADARERVTRVREGLRALLGMLDGPAGRGPRGEEYRLEPPPADGRERVRAMPARAEAALEHAAVKVKQVSRAKGKRASA
ncbi:MAG: MerR family transcriptional regulator [Acidobacteria bacterium]|nr:MerR family transcriptional regulator [Acidobacteriota bacterium]